MPVNYQIIPEHSYPHQTVQINDNSVIPPTFNIDARSVNSALCVFASPKGRSGVRTIKGLSAFVKEYGLGSFAHYGQPYLNAFAAASTGNAVLHCLRVTAADATHSLVTIVAKYKVDDDANTVSVKFTAEPAKGDVTELDDLISATDVDNLADSEGYTAVKLFTIAYQGKGEFGKNIRFRIRGDKSSDKMNPYKNYMIDIFELEDGLQHRESFPITFVEDSLYGGKSLYAEDILNNLRRGSEYIKIVVNPDGFKTIFDKYKEQNATTDLTLETFDLLMGVNKNTNKAIENLILEPETNTNISLAATTGIGLLGGKDGAIGIDKDPTARKNALNKLYEDAFNGKIDPLIVSSNRFPTTFIFDANYPVSVKKALVSLNTRRKDSVAVIDITTDTRLHSAVKAYVTDNLDIFVNDRDVTIEGYNGKARDPISKKIVEVTSTYALILKYFNHFELYNGKHKPMAGNTYGIIEGMIEDTMYPVFDEDIHSELMDELAEAHINFAKFSPKQDVVRATQDTRQRKLSALSELSCVLILKDITRDAKRLASEIEYEFSEDSDISRFNAMLEGLTNKYADAQVRSINATFAKSTWEAQHSTIHLYIAMVNKDIIRNTIIEIDVNRDDL